GRTNPSAASEGLRTLRLQGIAHASYSVNELLAEALVDLVPQVVHVYVDDVTREVTVVCPHVVQDLGAREHLPLVPKHQFEQLELLHGQLDLHISANRAVTRDVERQVARPQTAVSVRRAHTATPQRSHPRQPLDH